MPRFADVHKIHTFLGHYDCVYTLELAPEKLTFFSGGADGIVAHWNTVTGQSISAILRANAPIYTLKLSPDKRWLVVGRNDGGIHVIELEKKLLFKSSQVQSKAIFSLGFTSNQECLSGSGDGTVCFWNIETWHCDTKLILSQQAIRTIVSHPTLPVVAISGTDGWIRLLDYQNKNIVHSWKASEQTIFSLQFSPCGSFLISGGKDAHLRCWDLNGNLISDVIAHLFAIQTIQWLSDQTHFITGSMDKTIKVWHFPTLKLLKVIDKKRNDSHASGINQLLVLADSILSCSDDKQIIHWKIEFLKMEIL
ncbi:MAG: hypothetical protein NZ108_04690 [Bacteroidia bacterium]|nr:hypothetical protein [Bacteroidia bacterium]